MERFCEKTEEWRELVVCCVIKGTAVNFPKIDRWKLRLTLGRIK